MSGSYLQAEQRLLDTASKAADAVMGEYNINSKCKNTIHSYPITMLGYCCVFLCVCVWVSVNPASLKISLDCEIPVSAQGLRHSDLLGKAAALINCIHPERSHCLTVNVPSIVSTPACTSGTPFNFLFFFYFFYMSSSNQQ